MTGFVFLDKPDGITSFIASAKVKRIFHAKKSGHTGTLDPMATGVMVVALGGATRFIELIPDHNKAYVARFRLGITTDTLDITGRVTDKKSVTAKRQEVEKALDGFRGEIIQLPPMYSAVKKDGVRLYDLARQGIEIEREERKVNIFSLELTDSNEEKGEYEIRVECSKGTYIRSLISDIGQALDCGAVMTELRRIKANSVSIEDCFTLEELEVLRDRDALEEIPVKVEDLLPFTKITVSQAQARRFSNGGELDLKRLKGISATGFYRVFSPENKFLGVGEIKEGSEELSVKRVYVEL